MTRKTRKSRFRFRENTLLADMDGHGSRTGSRHGRCHPHHPLEGMKSINSSNRLFHVTTAFAGRKEEKGKKGKEEKAKSVFHGSMRLVPIKCCASHGGNTATASSYKYTKISILPLLHLLNCCPKSSLEAPPY